VRNSLQRHLYPRWRVGKAKKILLGDRVRSLNPDLVFADNDGEGAVGDVKYRLNTDGEIRRSDLNQVTTFATGFRSAKAVVVAFSAVEVGETVQIDAVQVRNLNWNRYAAEPEEAARKLADHIYRWLERSPEEFQTARGLLGGQADT
jgi:Holliday junction resolvase